MDYLDFELRIMPGAGREYPISVLQSPAGEASATMRFPFDTLALQNQLQGLEIAVLRSGGVRRDVTTDEHEMGVSEFGRQLFESLMTDTVRETFRRSQDRARGSGKGLRLRLRIEAPELAAIPWEYLYDPAEADYVCLSADTPVIRYMEFDRPPEALTVRPPLSILGMIASPSDRPALEVEREKQRIEAATAGLRDAGLLKLTWVNGSTWRDLQRAMRQGPFHIFHFVGHGGFDAASDEGVIALTSEEGKTALLSATQLGRLLADHQSLRMVILNSCLGAKGSTSDIFSSTASILVRRGVSAVVAMQYEISDRAAVEFARSLYEAMADGMPVDTAVTEARKAISLSVNNSVEWGTPVLHMRSPDGVLFRIDGMTTSIARASGFYLSTPSMRTLSPRTASRPALPATKSAATVSRPFPDQSGKRWFAHRRSVLLGWGVFGLILAAVGSFVMAGKSTNPPPIDSTESGAVYLPTGDLATWVFAKANVHEAVLLSTSTPGLWQLRLAVYYTDRLKDSLQTTVECQVGEEGEGRIVQVPVRFLPNKGSGVYQNTFSADGWPGGSYPIGCKIGNLTVPVPQNRVFLPAAPPESQPAVPFSPATLARDLRCRAGESTRSQHSQPASAQAYNWRGDRCEGLYDRKFAVSNLAIVSFTPKLKPYSPDTIQSLYLGWPSPVDSAVHIRVRGIGQVLNYGMDASVLAGTNGYEWPTTLIRELKLEQRDIGAVSWTRRRIGDAWHDVYLPLRIAAARDSDFRAATPADTAPREFALRLFSTINLTAIYLTLGPAGADGQLVEGQLRMNHEALKKAPFGRNYPVHTLITLAPNDPRGLYRLAVSATTSNGDPVVMEPVLLDLSMP